MQHQYTPNAAGVLINSARVYSRGVYPDRVCADRVYADRVYADRVYLRLEAALMYSTRLKRSADQSSSMAT
jgi:hypothetical protein